MNLIHIKYAIEVARAGSINKASENLNMAQPNISRAIKDLESDLGITIFDRSAKGMNLTSEGREFIIHAQKILNQINEFEEHYRNGNPNSQRFSISAPRAGYIAEAFSKFSQNLENRSAEIVFDEIDAYGTIKKINASDCKLGIIRYEESVDRNFKDILDKNGLAHREIVDFKQMIITHKESELARNEQILEQDLSDFIQITHNQPYEVTISAVEGYKNANRTSTNRCIFILDTAAQLELLSENKTTFMWASPAPSKLLDRYNLVQKSVSDNKKVLKDVLIYRKDTKLSPLDEIFIENLFSVKNEIF